MVFKSLATDITNIHCKSISLKPKTGPAKLHNLVLSPALRLQPPSFLRLLPRLCLPEIRSRSLGKEEHGVLSEQNSGSCYQLPRSQHKGQSRYFCPTNSFSCLGTELPFVSMNSACFILYCSKETWIGEGEQVGSTYL